VNPQFPVYIISKGRWQSRVTARHLEQMGVPYRIVVEEAERAQYAAVIDPARILILDPIYRLKFDACMDLAPDQSAGSGPARNFVWDHAEAAGADYHWIMDDNIRGFTRMINRQRIQVSDGTIFRCMEDWVLRWRNIALAGPNYHMFGTTSLTNKSLKPIVLNTRLYSCILIRTDLPFRWRCRYNEDVDLSLRILKAGWCTAQFNAFLQRKLRTQTMKGGNTDAFYAAEGTLPKSQMLVRLHPDVARLTWKFGRWHHQVDYGPFRANRLIRRDDIAIPSGVDNYGMVLRQLASA
jgi:hypothetical protein